MLRVAPHAVASVEHAPLTVVWAFGIVIACDTTPVSVASVGSAGGTPCLDWPSRLVSAMGATSTSDALTAMLGLMVRLLMNMNISNSLMNRVMLLVGLRVICMRLLICLKNIY